MSKTSTLNIRIEPKLKEEAESTLNDLGMNIAEAVTIFLKQVVITESIPFEIKKQKYKKELIEALKEAKDIANNPEKYKSYSGLAEILEEIDLDETI